MYCLLNTNELNRNYVASPQQERKRGWYRDETVEDF